MLKDKVFGQGYSAPRRVAQLGAWSKDADGGVTMDTEVGACAALLGAVYRCHTDTAAAITLKVN